jgi:oligopeptide transport system substrate-binding protein
VKLNGIVFFPIQSDNTEERAFRDGQLHATSTLPLSVIPKYRNEHPEVYHEDPNLAVYFYRVNVTSKQPNGQPHPVTDKRVRKALALAIDRESLIRNVLRAGQQPAVGFTPYPDSIGFKDAPHPLHFDPAEARRILADAGFPDGKGFPAFEILINTNEAHRTIAEALQEMWKKHLNIPVSIRNQDWGVYLNSQRQLDYTVCRAAWNADYLDPSTFLNMWRTGDGNNETGWSNARYDELIKLATLEGDPEKRMSHFREAETILLDELERVALPVGAVRRHDIQVRHEVDRPPATAVTAIANDQRGGLTERQDVDVLRGKSAATALLCQVLCNLGNIALADRTFDSDNVREDLTRQVLRGLGRRHDGRRCLGECHGDNDRRGQE